MESRVSVSLVCVSPMTLLLGTLIGFLPLTPSSVPILMLFYGIWFNETTPVIQKRKRAYLFLKQTKEQLREFKIVFCFLPFYCDRHLMTILNMLTQEDHSSHLVSKSQAWLGRLPLTEIHLALIMQRQKTLAERGNGLVQKSREESRNPKIFPMKWELETIQCRWNN